MIEDYIRANPEVVRELIQLGEREAEERRQAADSSEMMLVTHSSAMLTPASSSMFSDYNQILQARIPAPARPRE